MPATGAAPPKRGIPRPQGHVSSNPCCPQHGFGETTGDFGIWDTNERSAADLRGEANRVSTRNTCIVLADDHPHFFESIRQDVTISLFVTNVIAPIIVEQRSSDPTLSGPIARLKRKERPARTQRSSDVPQQLPEGSVGDMMHYAVHRNIIRVENFLHDTLVEHPAMKGTVINVRLIDVETGVYGAARQMLNYVTRTASDIDDMVTGLEGQIFCDRPDPCFRYAWYSAGNRKSSFIGVSQLLLFA